MTPMLWALAAYLLMLLVIWRWVYVATWKDDDWAKNDTEVRGGSKRHQA